MVIHTSTIVFTLLAAFAWTVLAYDTFARAKGWPVGEMFAADISIVKAVGLVSFPGAAIAAGYLAVWWSGLVVLVAGFVLAFVMTSLLRSYVQAVSVIGLAVCWVAGIIMLLQSFPLP